MVGLKSSVAQKGRYVTQIIHFVGGHCKTIHGVDTETIEQGQFTKLEEISPIALEIKFEANGSNEILL